MGTVGVNINAPANPQMASATRKGRLGMTGRECKNQAPNPQELV
jgi:hypothetical protein